MPWIREDVWKRMQGDLDHRVTHDASLVDRVVRMENVCKDIRAEVVALSSLLTQKRKRKRSKSK